MVHKYKVGDKVRILKADGLSLTEGGEYWVEFVSGLDWYKPVGITNNIGIVVYPHIDIFELVTDDNTDLTENRIQLGLLEPDVQERMRTWLHGCLVWEPDDDAWHPVEALTLCHKDRVYRALPAPGEPERVTQWTNVYSDRISGNYDNIERADSVALADRIAVWRITYDKETGLNPVIEVETKEKTNEEGEQIILEDV